jgi:hypothetical protein
LPECVVGSCVVRAPNVRMLASRARLAVTIASFLSSPFFTPYWAPYFFRGDLEARQSDNARGGRDAKKMGART